MINPLKDNKKDKEIINPLKENQHKTMSLSEILGGKKDAMDKITGEEKNDDNKE